MKTQLREILGASLLMLFGNFATAQNAEVDINLNIKHSVGGVSDFGRERHITVHSNIYENDWEGEKEKANYLFNELDASLGRDNGTATFLFQYSPEDEENNNHHDPDSLTILLDFWKLEYDRTLESRDLGEFKSRNKNMIMGTNPHPTFPTLSYYDNGVAGSQWGRENGYTWITQDIETSADWMIQYLDEFFAKNVSEAGMDMPEYWEIVNEPDFPLNTGQFMMSSWQDIFEYHKLVARGVKAKLGDKAPKIGGMTWGQHDLFNRDGIPRFQTPSYVDGFYGNTPGDELAKAYARGQVDKPYFGENFDWFQWEVIWKGFMDVAGDDMDFYSVHMYDWPIYDAEGGVKRSGGHVEALLEMIESYDVQENGINNRKPLVISEYGAVNNGWDFKPHDKRYDWECLKPFSSMLMQYLERPDYIELSMPFTPIKAQWGDNASAPYHYKMMRDDDGDGNWEWSDYIKWFELWDDIEGTRVDTQSTDPDIQVDAYVEGKVAYLILNNLENEETSIGLNFFEDFNNPIQDIRIKQLFLEGTSNIVLADDTTTDVPNSITLKGDATMVLKYTFANNINVNQTSVEKKFHGDAVSDNQRRAIKGGNNRFFVKGVEIPTDASKSEALLKVTVSLFDAPDNEPGFLSIEKLIFNGVEVPTPLDWRGGQQLRSKWFGTLEIPIPTNLIQVSNTIDIDFKHVGEVNTVNLVTWDFSKTPGRTNSVDMEIVDVTGINVAPTGLSLNIGDSRALTSTIEPANATNKSVTWTSSDTNIATVNSSGEVTGVAEGTTTITATSNDNSSFLATSTVTIKSVEEGDPLVIEAESFITTGGTYNDTSAGGSGLGVNIAGSIINYVNAGDYTTYNVNITEAGNYSIQYLIATPSENSQIQFVADGVIASTDNVISSGSWGNYRTLNAGENVALSAGSHSIRINAIGSSTWQWNLDKITLVKEDSDSVTVAVTGVSISPATSTLEVGNSSTVNGSVIPSDATNKSITYSSNNTSVATVNTTSGSVTAISSGTAIVTATSNDGNFTATSSITVISTSNVAPLIIEAEDFNTTGGTFNDSFAGGSGLGVNINNQNIDYVNPGDYTTYNINVASAGTYSIEYLIATPSNNSQIQIIIDDAIISTDNVVNNGQWNSFVTLSAANSANLSAGNHTVRINATGSNTWQWNLDKIKLTKVTQATNLSARNLNITSDKGIVISPNPVNEILNVSGINGENINYKIYNINNSLIMNGTLENNTINVQFLPLGMYFIQFTIDGKEQNTTKFIKQ